MAIDAGLCNRQSAARQRAQHERGAPMCFGITLEGGCSRSVDALCPSCPGCNPAPAIVLQLAGEITAMKLFRHLVTASLILPASLFVASCSGAGDSTATDPTAQDPGVGVALSEEASGPHINAITEAPVGFDNLTNGF